MRPKVWFWYFQYSFTGMVMNRDHTKYIQAFEAIYSVCTELYTNFEANFIKIEQSIQCGIFFTMLQNMYRDAYHRFNSNTCV